MKRIFNIILLFAAISLIFACHKDDKDEPTNEPEPTPVNPDPKPEPEPEPAEPDTEAPKLVTSTPAEGSVKVPLTGEIVLTFDEDVKFVNENPQCFVGYGMGLSTQLAPKVEGKTITFNYENLLEGVDYFFRIAAEELSDLSGNVNKEAVQLTFSTLDENAPKLLKAFPSDGIADIPLSGKATLIFSEDIKIASEDPQCFIGTTKMKPTVNGKRLTLEYSGLEAGKEYQLKIDPNTVADLSDNAISNAVNLKFTTADPQSGKIAVFAFVAGDNFYKDLTLQVGLAGSTDVLGEAVIDENGKAVFNANIGQAAVGKDVWFCVPKVAKFFHKFTADDVEAGALLLPDKDGGSTVTSDGLSNDWIVALYMGIDKDGVAGGAPLYWASGNLIAIKTNGAGSESKVVYRIATAEETDLEGTANNNKFVMLDDKLVANVADGYAALPAGSMWDMYAFGDPTGLRLYDYDHIDQYCIDLGQMNESKDVSSIAFDISGDPRFDAARAQLGGLWRIPTGGQKTANELAGFEDTAEEYASLEPNAGPDGKATISFGLKYAYTTDAKTVNYLKLPAAGFRHDVVMAQGVAMFCLYWSATGDPTGTPGYEAVEGGQGEIVDKTGQTVDVWHTAYGLGFMNRQKSWFIHPRTSSQCIRPVTE